MSLKEFKKKVAPYIVDVGHVPLLKETILYSLFAERLHSLIISPPSVGAKSSMRFFLERVSPNFVYIASGGWTRKVGIADAIIQMNRGIAFFDEIQRATSDELQILYDILQFQIIKRTIHKINKEYPADVNIIATANPVGFDGSWKNYGNIEIMREQITIEKSLLRRFHIIICMDNYKLNEFDKVIKKKDKISFSDDELKELEEFRKYIIRALTIDPEYKVPSFVYNFLHNLKSFDRYVLFPVTPELKDGIINTAIARARIDLSHKVKSEHWDDVIKFYFNVLKTSGLREDLIRQKFMKGVE